MATKNELDAAEGAPATAPTTVVTPRTLRTGPLLAVIGGSALAAALLLGGGVVLGFTLGHGDHQPLSIAQLGQPDGFERGPLGDGPRDGDVREVGPRPGPQQNQQQGPLKGEPQDAPESDSE